MKTISFFVLVMFMSSCSSEKNSLTETSILKHLSEKEIQHPIVFKTTLPKTYIKSVNDLSNGSNYYSQLYNDGYLTTQLRTDIPNPNASYRPYEVITTPTAEPYIVERKSNGSISLKTLEFNAVAVNDIRIISDFKAEVDVLYKKNKSPFYNPASIDISQSGKKYPNGTYVKTLEFRKNKQTNEWKYPVKVIF